MSELSIAYFTARIEELRRDWPLLIADADLGRRLSEELTSFGLDDVMQKILGSGSEVSV
jgi:hypothetical protein